MIVMATVRSCRAIIPHLQRNGGGTIVTTPHIAFSSAASVEELRQRSVEEVIRVLAGETPRNPVPPP